MTGKKTAGAPRGFSKAEQRAETLDRILNSAEHLFSQRGFHGVTFKDVAADIDVHTSLLHYYFADKEALFDQVFSRRSEQSRDARLAAIAAFEEANGSNATVEDVLELFVVPLFGDDNWSEGWANHARLIALINSTPDIGVSALSNSFDPVMRKLTEMMITALPGASRRDIYWGFQMVTGILMQMLSRIDQWGAYKDGRDGEKRQYMRTRLVPFMAAGFRSITNSAPTPR